RRPAAERPRDGGAAPGESAHGGESLPPPPGGGAARDAARVGRLRREGAPVAARRAPRRGAPLARRGDRGSGRPRPHARRDRRPLRRRAAQAQGETRKVIWLAVQLPIAGLMTAAGTFA